MLKNIKQHSLSLLFSTVLSLQVVAQPINYGITPPKLDVQTYILMDYHSGTVLAALNPDQRQYPASLTKMMTSYVVGDALKQGKIQLNDLVKIGESAWGKNFPGSSKMFLNLNQQVSISDLNRGVIIVSGNDSSVAIAEHLSGSVPVFVAEMNRYARQFGLKNTHFTTPHGLDDENQYSSARDMALIGIRLIRDLPEEYQIYQEKEFTFNKITQKNRNGLLWDKSLQVDGIKTGHTDKAGYNLVASAVNPNQMRLISVVMGVPTLKGRETESKKLLQWGFANFETFKTLEANKSISQQPVYYGVLDKVPLGTLQDRFITLPRGKHTELKARYELQQKFLQAPLSKGQIVGRVVYQLEGKDIEQVDLQVLQDISEGGIFSRLWDWLRLTISSLFD